MKYKLKENGVSKLFTVLSSYGIFYIVGYLIISNYPNWFDMEKIKATYLITYPMLGFVCVIVPIFTVLSIGFLLFHMLFEEK